MNDFKRYSELFHSAFVRKRTIVSRKPGSNPGAKEATDRWEKATSDDVRLLMEAASFYNSDALTDSEKSELVSIVRKYDSLKSENMRSGGLRTNISSGDRFRIQNLIRKANQRRSGKKIKTYNR